MCVNRTACASAMRDKRRFFGKSGISTQAYGHVHSQFFWFSALNGGNLLIVVPLGVLLPFLGVVFSCCGMHVWSRVTCLGPVHYLLFLRKDGQGDMFTVALRGDVCVQPVVHTGMGSLPMRLLLLSICMLCLVHPVGGQGGGVGSPVQRSSPTPSQETYPLCLLLGA